MHNSNNEKDRQSTESRLLKALGDIILNDGFDKVGVNSVATRAGVSKVLIYRYFGSIDNMIIEYLTQNDFWLNFSAEFPKNENLKEFVKRMFHEQIKQLRANDLMTEVYRWELTTQNSVIDKLRLKREAKGVMLVAIASQMSQHPQEEVAAVATLLSCAISYLVVLSQNCPVYNGIDIQSDKGWDQLTKSVDLLIDLWFDNIKSEIKE